MWYYSSGKRPIFQSFNKSAKMSEIGENVDINANVQNRDHNIDAHNDSVIYNMN